jgi:glycosyltransferase involved in cell wall biosynthesis/Flp pilus assembly protein TadD
MGASLSDGADVHVGHQWPPDFTPPAEGHWVIIQPWEYGSIPHAWLTPMQELVDEVWVPSRFVRNCFIHSGVPAEQVQVVPNGVAEIFFQPQNPYPLATTKKFKFLFVGGTIPRKGIDLLLQVYQQCFSAADDVCLVIKDMGVGTFYQGQTAEQMIAAIRNKPQAPEIEYHAEELSQEDMARLYAACDCLVHPYRAEGFGLPIAEALAAGLPVIVTGFGAALDFCDNEHAYLIPARAQHLPSQPGEMPTVDQQFWAQPDMDYLRWLLKHVVDHPDEARAKARRGQAFLRANYTWEHAAAVAEARLGALCKRLIRRLHPRAPAVATTPYQGNGKTRVSLTMIVKNEEHNLGDCLQSVADLVDEIVIADTGSSDGTKEIARQFGAKVVEFPWVNSFSAARNEALRHATGDWIFWMDADDRLDEANRRKLQEVFAGLPNGRLLGYNMKVSCLPGPDQESPTVVDHIRLFPNHAQIRWKYRIHEQILVAIRKLGGTVEWTDVTVQHVGYQDADVHRRKGDRNFALLQLDYQDDPDDPYTLFNLGNMYHEYKRYDEAIDLLTKSLRRSEPSDSIVRKLYSLIAQCRVGLAEYEAAVSMCREGRTYYPNDIELLFVESGVLHKLGDRPGAVACLQRLRISHDDPHFGSVNTGLRSMACNSLGVLFMEMGQFQESEQSFRQAIAEASNYLNAWLGLADLYLKQQRLLEVEEIIQRLGQKPTARLEKTILQAQLCLARKAFAEARSIIEQVIQQAPQSVFARLVLSRVLLQEGRDWQAAEQALRDVLALDPDHSEARNNLEILLRQRSSD